MIDKQQVRKTLIQKRNNLSLSDIQKKSTQIKQLLMNHPFFMQAKTILFYISYGKEVATHEIIKHTLSTDKTVIVPISNTKNYALTPSILSDWNHLQPGAYHILEPVEPCIHPIDPTRIDLILIPGIGFDETGNRMGHGKGYYDRFLPIAPQAKRIGLSFEFQIVDQIPVHQFDQKVGVIVTEKRIINCHEHQRLGD